MATQPLHGEISEQSPDGGHEAGGAAHKAGNTDAENQRSSDRFHREIVVLPLRAVPLLPHCAHSASPGKEVQGKVQRKKL